MTLTSYHVATYTSNLGPVNSRWNELSITMCNMSSVSERQNRHYNLEVDESKQRRLPMICKRLNYFALIILLLILTFETFEIFIHLFKVVLV